MPRRTKPGITLTGLLVTMVVAASGVGAAEPARAPEAAPPVADAIAGLLGEAARAREAGAMERAAGLYAQILELDPEHRVALYNAGIILENAGRYELAAGVWGRALGADAGDLYAWEHLLRSMAELGRLDEALAALEAEERAAPDADVPRLARALALSQAGRWQEAVAALESFLIDHPASNIAYNFLKDAFVSLAALEAYVAEVGRRAALEGAPESLALLHVRLLLERGRAAEAMAAARGRGWKDAESRTLLARAGLASPAPGEEMRLAKKDMAGSGADQAPAAVGPGGKAGASDEGLAGEGDEATAGSMAGQAAEVAGGGAPAADRLEPEAAPLEEFPDFGPDDPRSAPRYLAEGRLAMAERDDAAALASVWRAVEAAPLQLQPRILLAVLLEQEGRPGAARAALRGPVEPAPWDVYMQGWRAVRDDFIDAGYGGADVYALREAARRSLRAGGDARSALAQLLQTLGDRYALLFTPDRFAGYLLAPNATGGSPRVMSPWVPVPATDEADHAGVPSPAPPEPVEGHEPEPTQVPVQRRRGLNQLEAKPTADETQAGESESMAFRPVQPRAPAVDAAYPRDPQPQVSLLPDGMAMLRLPSLSGLEVPRQVEQALAELPGFRGLVIDLRGNRGGDGEVAAEVASLFLPAGREICTYRTRRGKEVRRSTRLDPFEPPAGLAVLTDGTTASAAELLAAALAESAAALRVGERSAGKGVGQRALLLPDGSGMSITRFQLLSPQGRSWDGEGLTPDFAVAAGLPEHRGGQADSALQAALALLRSGARPEAR